MHTTALLAGAAMPSPLPVGSHPLAAIVAVEDCEDWENQDLREEFEGLKEEVEVVRGEMERLRKEHKELEHGEQETR